MRGAAVAGRPLIAGLQSAPCAVRSAQGGAPQTPARGRRVEPHRRRRAAERSRASQPTMRNKHPRLHAHPRPRCAGYAFLEFRTHEAADMLLKSYNGQPIPGTDQVGPAPRAAQPDRAWLLIVIGASVRGGNPAAAPPSTPPDPPGFRLPSPTQVFRLNWAAYGVGKAQPAGEGAAAGRRRGEAAPRGRRRLGSGRASLAALRAAAVGAPAGRIASCAARGGWRSSPPSRSPCLRVKHPRPLSPSLLNSARRLRLALCGRPGARRDGHHPAGAHAFIHSLACGPPLVHGSRPRRAAPRRGCPSSRPMCRPLLPPFPPLCLLLSLPVHRRSTSASSIPACAAPR